MAGKPREGSFKCVTPTTPRRRVPGGLRSYALLGALGSFHSFSQVLRE
ncbi:hypothetical protein [Metallosphaera yellowstonensis]|nr:hypothetical protein [Metallosphaera yellowstonensis]